MRLTHQLTSETRTFTATDARPIFKIEQIDNTDTATLSSHNLDEDGEISFTDATHPANQICIYAPERDIEIEMDLFGGKGSDGSGNEGGEGGKSTIKFTLDQNVEYIITGLYDESKCSVCIQKSNFDCCRRRRWRRLEPSGCKGWIGWWYKITDLPEGGRCTFL